MDKRRLSLLVVALLATAAAAGAAETFPCGPDNRVNQCFHQANGGVDSVAESGDRFGAALAFGDFDGDGRDDLAIGAPGDDLPGLTVDAEKTRAGFVHVFYGTFLGLELNGEKTDQFSRDDLPGPNARDFDEFGSALAAGDFDGDGFDDLAIGIPFDDHPGCGISGCDDGGSFQVVYGSDQGLDLTTAETFEGLGIGSFVPHDGTLLGATLGAGHVDDDGISDLLVCAPGYSDGDAVPDLAGRCFRVFGAAGGLGQGTAAQLIATGTGSGQLLGEDLAVWDTNDNGTGLASIGHPGFDCDGSTADCGAVVFSPSARLVQGDLPGGSDADGDRFGAALAVGRFDGDAFEDLAIGVPELSPGGLVDSGQLYVVFGAPGALDLGALASQRLDQSDFGGSPEDFDETGAALAAGDFDGDGIDDLALGAPGETSLGEDQVPEDFGQVTVVFGGTGLDTLDVARNLELAAPELGRRGPPGGSNARLGASLAVGDVDGDGRDELAIGAPNEAVVALSGFPNAGRVYVHKFPSGAGLAATKTVSSTSGSFEIGSAVTYTITIENTGIADHPDLPGSDELLDEVPDELTVTAVSASSGSAVASGNRVTWNGVVPLQGSVALTIDATIDPGTAGELVSNQGVGRHDVDRDGIADGPVLTDDPSRPGPADATLFEVFCPFAADTLVLDSNPTDGVALFEACRSIHAGGDFEVGAGDDVTFRAGRRVVLRDGFRVLAGGRFTAVIEDP